MKCKTLAGVGILTVFFLLVAGWLSPGFADDVTRSGESPRAIELAAQAPKTPEEFLRLVREWMDDPYMDAYVFIERLSGVKRELWKSYPKDWTAGGKNYSYDPFDYFDKSGKAPSVSFDIRGIQITSTNHLWDIIIPFHDESFCVSAEMVRKILGEPVRIKGRLPNKSFEFGPSQADVTYFYKTKKYELEVSFAFKKGKFKDRSEYSRKERKKMKRLIESIKLHRDICASGIRFGTYEGRK